MNQYNGYPRSQAPASVLLLAVWKAGRAWYLFSNEHDIIDKWNKFQNESKFGVLFNQLQVQHLVCMTTIAPCYVAGCMWWVTWYLSSSCCSKHQCAHIQLTPFLPPFYPCCHASDKGTRPSVFFMQPKKGSYELFGVYCQSSSHTDKLKNQFCRYIFPSCYLASHTPNYEVATHIVYPLLATVTFWEMETVVSFTRREDWAEPLQVYCPPCEVCRGKNVIVW